MSLHLVYCNNGWLACRDRIDEHDAVLLLGDGVYLARRSQERCMYALAEDMESRGVRMDSSHTAVTYAQFVELCVQHAPVVSWNE